MTDDAAWMSAEDFSALIDFKRRPSSYTLADLIEGNYEEGHAQWLFIEKPFHSITDLSRQRARDMIRNFITQPTTHLLMDMMNFKGVGAKSAALFEILSPPKPACSGEPRVWSVDTDLSCPYLERGISRGTSFRIPVDDFTAIADLAIHPERIEWRWHRGDSKEIHPALMEPEAAYLKFTAHPHGRRLRSGGKVSAQTGNTNSYTDYF